MPVYELQGSNTHPLFGLYTKAKEQAHEDLCDPPYGKGKKSCWIYLRPR